MKNEKLTFNAGEAAVPALAAGFGLAYFIQVSDAPFDAIRWPVMVASVTAFCGVILAATHMFRAGPERKPFFSGGWTKSLAVCLVPLLFLVLLPYAGFFISSLLLLTCLFRLLGSTLWFRNLMVAGTLVLMLYLALVVFMKLSLPRLEIGPYLLEEG